MKTLILIDFDLMVRTAGFLQAFSERYPSIFESADAQAFAEATVNSSIPMLQDGEGEALMAKLWDERKAELTEIS